MTTGAAAVVEGTGTKVEIPKTPVLTVAPEENGRLAHLFASAPCVSRTREES